MSCCTAGHLGSGVGQPDLNQYFPSLCLLVSATKEVQRIPSKEGLLLAAGGEGRLAEGQGRLRERLEP